MTPVPVSSSSVVAPSGSGAPTAGLRTIKEVLGVLAEEFPELTGSKVRFLEERGLISPERTPAGYRKFSQGDVDRLRLVLVLQRDHHMPLKEIRERLAAVDAGDSAALSGIRPRLVTEVPTGAEAGGQERPLRLREREFLALTGASAELLAQLQEYHIVMPSASGLYGQKELDIVSIAVEMAHFGIEPRHLRSMKASADRDAALVEQVVSPMRRQRVQAGAAQADVTQQSLAGLCVRLHAAMLGIGSGPKPRAGR